MDCEGMILEKSTVILISSPEFAKHFEEKYNKKYRKMGRFSLDESKYRNSDSNLVILTNPDEDYIERVVINATRHKKARDFPNGFHVIFLIIDPNFAESIQILDKAIRYINTRRTLIIAPIILSEKQKILGVLNKIKEVQESIKPLLPSEHM